MLFVVCYLLFVVVGVDRFLLLVVVRCWLLLVAWFVVCRCWVLLFVVCGSLFVLRCLLSVGCYVVFVVRGLVFVVCCSLCVVSYLLLVVVVVCRCWL